MSRTLSILVFKKFSRDYINFFILTQVLYWEIHPTFHKTSTCSLSQKSIMVASFQKLELNWTRNSQIYNIKIEVCFEFLCVTSFSVCKAPFENLLESRVCWLARHTIFCSAALCKRRKKKKNYAGCRRRVSSCRISCNPFAYQILRARSQLDMYLIYITFPTICLWRVTSIS